MFCQQESKFVISWTIDRIPNVQIQCDYCLMTYLRNDHEVCPYCADVETESEYFTDYGDTLPPLQQEEEFSLSIPQEIPVKVKEDLYWDDLDEEKLPEPEKVQPSEILDPIPAVKKRIGRPRGIKGKRRRLRLSHKKYDWVKRKKLK